MATGNGTFDAAPSGAQSLGGTGGSLGYQGINDSVAVSFRAYTTSVTGLATNGGSFNNQVSTAPVDFQGNSGANPAHTYQATLAYDGTTLTETITDLNLPPGMNTFTTSYPVNIPQQVGGNTAFVGFTGGTGGLNAVQNVNTWTYTAGSTTIDHSGGFASHGDLTNNGSATFTSGGAAELTSGQNSQAGSIFTNNQVNVTNFTTTFTFQMKAGDEPHRRRDDVHHPGQSGRPRLRRQRHQARPEWEYGDRLLHALQPGRLSAADLDQGSGGVLLLPDSVGSAAHPQLLVQTGKSGTIYLIDRNNLGQYNPNGTGPNNVVQQLTGAIAGGGSYDTPAYYNGADLLPRRRRRPERVPDRQRLALHDPGGADLHRVRLPGRDAQHLGQRHVQWHRLGAE